MRYLILGLCFLLSACGTTGPLYLNHGKKTQSTVTPSPLKQ